MKGCETLAQVGRRLRSQGGRVGRSRGWRQATPASACALTPTCSGSPGIQTVSDSVRTVRLNVFILHAAESMLWFKTHPIPRDCFLAVFVVRRHRRRQPPLRLPRRKVLGFHDDTKASGERRGDKMSGGKDNFRVRVASVRFLSLLTAETRWSSARPRVGEAASARAACGEAGIQPTRLEPGAPLGGAGGRRGGSSVSFPVWAQVF